jgi:DHA2 family multidrug resistance protein-like MFS transporter
VVFALGLAPVYTLAADLMVGAAAPERAGSAAAVSETSSELGGALGIAVLGAVGTAVYRAQIDAVVRAGAAEAAKDTLGGAMGPREELPRGPASERVEAAREAFTQALQLTAAASAAIAIAAAILAVAMLRSVRPPGEAESWFEPDRAAAHGRPC